jgi:hypothetical protein
MREHKGSKEEKETKKEENQQKTKTLRNKERKKLTQEPCSNPTIKL